MPVNYQRVNFHRKLQHKRTHDNHFYNTTKTETEKKSPVFHSCPIILTEGKIDSTHEIIHKAEVGYPATHKAV